jgi:chromosome segregation protein
VALIEARNRVDQLEGRIGHTGDIVAELTRTQTLRADEIEQARGDIATCTTTIEAHEGQLKEMFEQREKLSEQQSRLREVQSGIIEKVTEAEKRIKEARDLRESLNDEIHKLEMRSNTISGEISAVRSRLLEEYETDVVGLEMERPDDKLDDTAAQEHLRNQKEKLKKFGAVNLLALEEYGTASEREKFLREQLDDLEAAKRDLQATISKINITARRMFLETFEKARENFQTLFVELFSGGDADISLTDPEDPLESPIEITARPRGKKLLSIAQMSGGERALTAISLLFSLYLVKPSPFCVLDEIDAPLDDANCHRFLKMIRHFAGQTQFVIITHNKITMEAADNLYGITMEMPGVSRLVAVRFNEAGDIIDQGPDAGAEVTEPEIPQAVRERITPSLKVPVDEEAGQ